MRNYYTILAFIFTILLAFGLSAQGWEQINTPPFRKHHTNGFGHDGKAYLLEGIFNEQASNEFWLYDPADDSWERLADFPGPARGIAIGDDWNGKYYYGFGNNGSQTFSDLWVFDPADMSFTELPSCPCVGRSHPSLVAHNDKIYMGAGSSANGDLRDWWEYDMITQEWTQKPDIPGGIRHHMFHFAIGDQIYVGGGHVDNWNRYDPATETWTPISNLPQGRVAGSQLDYDGYGLLIGGDDASHRNVPIEESFMRYNATSEEWEFLPSLPNGSRWAPTSFIVDDVLFFLGGINDVDGSDNTMWKFDLELLNCLPTQNLSAEMLTESSATLEWTANTGSDLDTLKWRLVGSDVWNIEPNPTPVFELSGLENCSDYEFQITSYCGDEFNSVSETQVFKTKGCCVNPIVSISSLTETSVTLEWPEVAPANSYRVRYRDASTNNWRNETTDMNQLMLDLNECTEYEFQIKSNCDISDNELSESTFFFTKGCGACIDFDYCTVSADLDGELGYINKVEINDYVNESGNNSGYENFAILDAEILDIGDAFSLVIEPGIGTDSSFLDVNVWVDLDGNGSFEEEERLLQQNLVSEVLEAELTIPPTATPGLTRMRVSYTIESIPCDEMDVFTLGETEDYCLILSDPVSTEQLPEREANIKVVPNPFTQSFTIQGRFSQAGAHPMQLFNVLEKPS